LITAQIAPFDGYKHGSVRFSGDDQHVSGVAGAVRLLVRNELHRLAIAVAEIALARTSHPQIRELLDVAAFRSARADAQPVRAALRWDGDLRDARTIRAGIHIRRAQRCGVRVGALPPTPAEEFDVNARTH